MSQYDREKWNAKYAPDEYVMGESIKPFLRLVETSIPHSGRSLDLACGEGQNAVWLARRGMEVTAVDISARGLEKLNGLARKRGVEGRVAMIEHDLDGGLPQPGGASNLFTAGGTPTSLKGPFNLVTCIHFYTPKGIAQARELLAPGGLLVVETLLKAGENPSKFGAEPGEVLTFAGGLHVHYYREGFATGRPTARLIAQRAPLTTVEFAADAG